MLSWANTHEDSLKQIQQFIGCGYIQRRKKKGEEYTRGYELKVNRALDVIRVGESMFPHLIIKREKVSEIISFVRANRKPLHENWGKLAAIPPEEVRRLYWDEKLTQEQVGQRFGVTSSSVKRYVRKHKIYARPSGPVPRRSSTTQPSSDNGG
jgi:hypothetical protein